MRENMGAYRGKTKDGEWVEGFLCFHYVDGKNENGFVYTGKSKIYDQENVKSCDVITETVGEWTGMKDKNGKRIFEGDIIGSMDGHDGYLSCERYIVGAVNWDDETLSWQVTNRIEAESYEILASDNETLEVIDNIHDNPELVKE